MSFAIGLILLIIGAAGAIGGPMDRTYVRDWCRWLLAVIVAVIGFLMMRPTILGLLTL